MRDGIGVTVCCIAYNQEQYIGQAIEGFLMQRTSFPLEIIIHDDASTDRTAEIIAAYVRRDGRIKAIIQKENQYSCGRNPMLDFVIPAATGRYLAFCEGDDFWIDPDKLEKQVGYMNAHPQMVICFHPVHWYDQSTGQGRKTYFGAPGVREVYALDDLLEYSNFIPTAAAMIRNRSQWNLPQELGAMSVGDYFFFVWLMLSTPNSKIGCLGDFMSVYRRHTGSLIGRATPLESARRVFGICLQMGELFGLFKHPAWQRGVLRWGRVLSEALIAAGMDEDVRLIAAQVSKMTEENREVEIGESL